MPAPYPIQARPPDGRRIPSGNGVSALFAVLATGLHALFLVGLLLATMFTVPHAERVYHNYNWKLDIFARFALDVTRWLYNYWYVLVLFLVPGFLLDALVLFVLNRSSRGRAWSYVLAFGLLLLIVLFGACPGAATCKSLIELHWEIRSNPELSR